MLEKNNIYNCDCLEGLKSLEENTIDSIVSDFPYNLSFMGREWDTISNFYEWCNDRAKEMLRVLKHGGYCLIFGGTRTHHRMVCAFEDAGFEIRDEIMWINGSGFPKSYNVSKGFIKKDNIELSKQWDGWGTALKPAHEPIMVAQKPIEKNYCYNLEKWGVGALNIDDSRIKNEGQGRFPANLLLDEEASKLLDEQSGILKSGSNNISQTEGFFCEHGGLYHKGDVQVSYGDSGGASRFFYCAKATKKDKTDNKTVENTHPTVKPTELIKYLVRLVTPPKGLCLDVCEGSGTHAKACIELTMEGYPVNFLGYEIEEEYYLLAKERIDKLLWGLDIYE